MSNELTKLMSNQTAQNRYQNIKQVLFIFIMYYVGNINIR